jgi:hypothetical protein
LNTKKSSIHRRSISVAKKQLIASSGVFTIGSPRTLKDVLIKIGTPVIL